MNVALAGNMGVGKTTIANILVEKYGFKRYSFATPIKEIAQQVGLPTRKFYQELGFLVRSHDPDAWVKMLDRKISAEKSPVVIDDLRMENEYRYLVDKGFLVVMVKVNDDMRIRRLQARDGYCNTQEMSHSSEQFISKMHHNCLLVNEGSLEVLESSVGALILMSNVLK